MKLVEAPVGKLNQALNDLMGYLVVAGSDRLVDVALKIDLNLRG